MNHSVSFVVLSLLSVGTLPGCGGAPNEMGHENEIGTHDDEVRAGRQDPADPQDPTTPIADRPRPIRPAPGPTDPPPIFAPPTADLQLDGVMRYYGYYDGALTLGLMINVINVGDTPVTAPNGRVSVAGVMLSGALYQYAGSATQPNTVNPWERGYIHVVVPTSLMAPCQTYAVQIDLDHTMQTGGAPVFANDSGSASTVCPLTWTTPIDELHLGTVPHWSVEGKSLSSIVSSFVSGRPDGALCSSCHNASASYPYHPNVAQNGSGLIGPYAPASGDQAWICTGDPWWHRFVFLPESTYPHTPYLREFVQKWVSDGAMP